MPAQKPNCKRKTARTVGCRLSLMPTTDVGALVNIGLTLVVVTRHLDRYMLMMGVMVVMALMSLELV